MEDHRFSFADIHLEDEDEKNITIYNKMLNPNVEVHSESKTLRPTDRTSLAGVHYPNQVIRQISERRIRHNTPHDRFPNDPIPNVKKIALINPVVRPIVRPNKPALFAKKVAY